MTLSGFLKFFCLFLAIQCVGFTLKADLATPATQTCTTTADCTQNPLTQCCSGKCKLVDNCCPGQDWCPPVCCPENQKCNMQTMKCGFDPFCPEGQQPCHGKCCPKGQCAPSGQCCTPELETICGEKCCFHGQCTTDGKCCPQTGGEACGDTCCPAGKFCFEGVCCSYNPFPVSACNGMCCFQDSPVCADGKCCPEGSDKKLCNGNCCPTGQCTSKGLCCPIGQTGCGDICCPTGQCLDGICCPKDTPATCRGVCCSQEFPVCSEDKCCFKGSSSKLCSGECCLEGRCTSKEECCPANQFACGDVCCAKGKCAAKGICCSENEKICGDKCYNPKTHACCDFKGKKTVMKGITQVIANVFSSSDPYGGFCEMGCTPFLLNPEGTFQNFMGGHYKKQCPSGQNPIFTFYEPLCPGTEVAFGYEAPGWNCVDDYNANFDPTPAVLQINSTDQNCVNYDDCTCKDGVCTFPATFVGG